MASINKNKLAEAAQKFLAKGQLDKALKEYERILSADSGDVSTRLKVGDLKLRLGQKEPAIAEYRRVAEKFTQGGFYSKGVAVLKRIITVEPNLLEAHLELAGLNQKLGLLSEVVHHYQIAANIHDRRGEKREAIDILKKVAEVGPPNLERRIKVAELYYREGLKDSGLEQFEAAVAGIDSGSAELVTITRRMWKACPGDPRLGRRLAQLLLARGDAKSAAEVLEEAGSSVRDPESLELLAEAKLHLGLAGEAKAIFQEALDLYQACKNPARAQEIAGRILEIASSALDVAAEAAESAAPAAAAAPEIIVEESAAGTMPLQEMSEDQHLEASLSEADVYEKYGKHDRAIQILEDLAARYPHRHEAPLRLRGIFESSGDWTSVAIQCRRLTVVAEGRGDAERAARFEKQALEAEIRAKGGAGGADQAPGSAPAPVAPPIEAARPTTVPVKLPPAPASDLLTRDAAGTDLGDIELVIEGDEEIAPPDAIPSSSAVSRAEPAPKRSAAPSPVAAEEPSIELDLRLDEETVRSFAAVAFPSVSPVRADEEDLILDDAFEVNPVLTDAPTAPPQTTAQEDFREIVLDLREAEEPLKGGAIAAPDKALQPRRHSVEEELILQEISAESGSLPEAKAVISSARRGEPEAVPDLGDILSLGASHVGANGETQEPPAEPGKDAIFLRLSDRPTTAAAARKAPAEEASPKEEIVLLDVPTHDEGEGGASRDAWNHPLFAEADLLLPDLFATEPVPVPAAIAPSDAWIEIDLEAPEPQPSAPAPAAAGAPRDRVLYGDSGFDLRAELDLDTGISPDALADATKELSDLVTELQRREENVPSSEDAQTHYDLGIAYKEMGLLDDAIRELRIAARDVGRKVECLAVLGICYCEQGKPEEALGMFEQCLALGGTTGKGAAGILYEMGMVHEESGNAASALECYHRVSEIDPDYRETRARMAGLQPGLEPPPPSRPSRKKKISYL